MTLTDPRPAASAPSRVAGPVVQVHAIVIADTSGGELAGLLEAVQAQSIQPTSVIVLDRTGDVDLAAALDRRQAKAPGGRAPVIVHGRRGWPMRADLHRTVVETLLTMHPSGVFGRIEALQAPQPTGDTPRTAAPDETATPPSGSAEQREPDDPADDVEVSHLVWALPVGAVPEPAALERLVAAWRRSPSVGIVGPKLLDAADPSRLRSLGIFATRTGRLVADPQDGEPDQGQYDRRSDVLAVPLAGALIERELITRLRGWPPSSRTPAADLDFGWRAHAVARRVVVVPSARVRCGPDVGRAVPSSGAERRAARRVALTRCSWWAAPFFALWVASSSLGAALALALLKRPGAAVHELGDVGAVGPVGPLLARLRTRGPRVVRRRDLASLFVPGRSIAVQVADGLHDAIDLPGRPTERTDIEIVPRSIVGHALRHPGVLAVLAVLAAAAVAGRSLGVGLLRGIGGGFDGGELVGSGATAQSLWHGYLDGWHGSGLGGTAPASPSLAVMSVLAWFSEHIPGAAVSSPGGAAAALLLVATLPLATASAYLALRVLTGHQWLRAAGALAWATGGAAPTTVADGRLGAAVALVLLPPVAAGMFLLSRKDGSATAAFACALAATVLGAFAPALLLLVMAVALVVLLAGARARALPVLVLPPILLGPWVLDAVHDPRLLLTGPGLSQWGGSVPPSWQLALGHPGGPGSMPYWVGIPLVVAGVGGLVRGRSPVGAWAMAVVALASLALTLLAPRVRLDTVPAGLERAGQPVTVWAGTFMLPLALALIAAAVSGLADAPLLRSTGGWVAVARWPVLAALVAAGVGGGVLAGWASFGTALHPWSDPRPAAAVDQAESDPAGRALWVTAGADGAAYRIVGREVSALARDLPTLSPDDRALAPAVSGLLDASPGTWDASLADQAVGLVGLRDGAAPELARRLDSTDGLTRLAGKSGWSYWRVRSVGTGDSRPATPPRLRLDDAAGSAMVPATGLDAATETMVTARTGSVLVVAEPLGWAEHASVTFRGAALAATPGSAQPTYAVPAGTGTLSVTVDGGPAWWRLLQGLGLIVLLFLAIPFGRRQSRGLR